MKAKIFELKCPLSERVLGFLKKYRPSCTIIELDYNRPKAIGRHCCLRIDALGYFISLTKFYKE